MPKSKHNRNGKSRTGRRSQWAATPRKSPLYEQPCPDELLVEEFGEDGAEWLLSEYERPLNRADLELEKAIRAGKFVLDHPEEGPVTDSLEKVAATVRMTTCVILVLARREGVLTQSQLEETGDLDDKLNPDQAPDEVRGAHWAGVLLLNHRGMWDFGEGE